LTEVEAMEESAAQQEPRPLRAHHRPGEVTRPASGRAGDARWYKEAVFYEVFVSGFYDGNRDGIGDLRGLSEKLDYLQWLGVGCLWLLPFYKSPLRDGGYDISDFFSILPAYGDLDDVRQLVEQATAEASASSPIW
jgi:1,4-alpha-glucan branching enzyme